MSAGERITIEPSNGHTQTTGDGEVTATFNVTNSAEHGQVRNLDLRVTNASAVLNLSRQNVSIESLEAENSTLVAFPLTVAENTPDGNYTVNVSVYQGEEELDSASYTIWVDNGDSDTGGSDAGESSGSDSGENDSPPGAVGVMPEDEPSWLERLTGIDFDWEWDWDWGFDWNIFD